MTNGSRGFTLVELIVGTAMAGLLVTAGISLSSHIHRTSKDDTGSMKRTSETDSVLSMINEEIVLSRRILTRPQDLPSGCSAGGGRFFLGLQLPPQAYGKGDYKTIANAQGKVTTRAQTNNVLCPTVIGLRSSSGSEMGPFVLYRYGPQIDSKGFYVDTSTLPMQAVTLLDGISTQPKGRRKSCNTNWSYYQSSGLEACIDQFKKSALLSVSRKITDAGREMKRSAAGGANILDAPLIPGMMTGSSGGVAGNTQWLGKNVQCDGTTFLLDKSGSMRVRTRSGGSRMDKAKNELITAISKCPDGAKINIYLFSSGYSAFDPRRDVALNANTRRDIERFIRGAYASGGTNPWGSFDRLIQNQSVKRIVALTDGGTWTSGRCFHNGRYMQYADCYSQYNANQRAGNPVQVESIALDTSCTTGYGRWLNDISKKTGGSCVSA